MAAKIFEHPFDLGKSFHHRAVLLVLSSFSTYNGSEAERAKGEEERKKGVSELKLIIQSRSDYNRNRQTDHYRSKVHLIVSSRLSRKRE